MVLESFDFDYTKFYNKLLIASRQGFQVLKTRHKDESFYCFGFYSHGSHGFIYAVASSEEGLTQVAQHYIDVYPERYGHISLIDMRTLLRHSIADSPLNEPDIMLPIFKEVCDLAEQRSITLHNIWSSLSDKVGDNKAFQLVQPQHDQFRSTCFSVLQQLYSEGLFDTGLACERVLLNFLMGDQGDEESITCALAINPTHIVKRYKTEIEAGRAIEQRIHYG